MIGPPHLWQETLVALHSAESVKELWAVLLAPHGLHSSSDGIEPLGLFRHFHEADAADAATTALLLCTDLRWRKATHRLVDGLAASGLLDDAALDGLAIWFLRPGVTIAVPRDLLEGLPVMFTPPAREPAADRVVAIDPAAWGSGAIDVVYVPRNTWPPLRRWAAARHIRRVPDRWRTVLESARTLPSRDGAAVAAGVMDAAASIRRDERAEATRIGIDWGSGTVRLAALPRLADLEGIEVARQKASRDPSAKVRAWAAKQSVHPPQHGTIRAGSPQPTTPGAAPGQPTLFEA